jgi:hypothetical protein
MNRNVFFIGLALFYAVFLICAGLLQLRSGLPPEKGGGATDQFNGALIWTTSVVALLIACVRPWPAWKLLFWLAVSAGFAAFAIDEVFEFHEQTRYHVGDDDYSKIAMWAVACFGVFLIYRVARPAREATAALIIAVGFTTLWLLVDLGDGDFFTIPIPLRNLFWIEEYIEMLASMFYLTALLLHYQNEFADHVADQVRGNPHWSLAAAQAVQGGSSDSAATALWPSRSGIAIIAAIVGLATLTFLIGVGLHMLSRLTSAAS